MNVVFTAPILLLTMPFQMIWMGLFPEDSLPGLPTVTSKEETSCMMWFNLMTFRLLMPYNYMLEYLDGIFDEGDVALDVKRYNLRYLTDVKAMDWMAVDWLSLPLIWLQSVVMFVLTLPAWPFVLANGF